MLVYFAPAGLLQSRLIQSGMLDSEAKLSFLVYLGISLHAVSGLFQSQRVIVACNTLSYSVELVLFISSL